MMAPSNIVVSNNFLNTEDPCLLPVACSNKAGVLSELLFDALPLASLLYAPPYVSGIGLVKFSALGTGVDLLGILRHANDFLTADTGVDFFTIFDFAAGCDFATVVFLDFEMIVIIINTFRRHCIFRGGEWIGVRRWIMLVMKCVLWDNNVQ